MEEETLEERQSNELEALKAIFSEQFVNCNEDCSEWKPLDVILTVQPLRERSGPSEAHVQLDLHVIACDEYPNKIPKIEIEKQKGLSDKQVAEIKKNLEELAASKVGEVMIYELVQYVQTILAEWNKPGFQSFYEEMLSRQEEEKRKEAERQETEENVKRQLIKLEVQGIKEERQRKKKGKNGKINDAAEKEDSPCDSPKFKSSLNENHKTKSQDDDRTDNKLLVEFFDRTCGVRHTVPLFHFNSRLVRDFEVLDFIGNGAYGDVLKVRNKLDDCLYAIKRIKLTQTNIAVNKKIMREVKLLSSLNHENVVRYYNSWLENLETEEIQRHESKKDALKKQEKLSADNLSMSFTFPRVLPSFSDDDDEEDEDQNDDWIEFRHSSNAATDSPNGITFVESDSEESEDTFHNQCMYIQMEYCEKSTLRNSIDDNLYKDENRVWRLLREVVEGLTYIHQQGIIHRDLKPVNLFIDSNDHVKIGDFGLATPNKPSSIKVQDNIRRNYIEENLDAELSDASYTGQVGTALYVAPELNSCAQNIHYNQKVDIYSLGIIFFEMCYRPFSTEMERYKVLTNLRLSSIIFPKDFYNDSKLTRQIKLIREFLNHNPSERPTAKDILEKGNLPLAPELENKKFYETIGHTLRNPQSKVYKHLVAECFNQVVSEAADITFDESVMDEKGWWLNAFVERMANTARKIFQLHGAVFLNTFLLSPNNGIGIKDAGVVPLMGRCGNIVNLPFDLKVTLARYLAQNPRALWLKRYTVDKVFRQRRPLGMHPKEIFECAFDIVSPSSNYLTMEAEVLSVVCEFLDTFDDILQKNFVIRLNHVSLVSAILLHHHIVLEKHVPVCSLLSKIKMNDPMTKTSVAKKLQGFNISDTVATNLINSLNVKVPPNKLSAHFENLKKSSASASYCQRAITQLELLIQYLQLLKVNYPVVISPSVMTNFHYYSGMMFQVVWERKQKKHLEKDSIIAAGGRYDNLISQFREALNITMETTQSVVGVSIFLDKFASLMQKDCHVFPFVDAVVCSIEKGGVMKDKLKLMNELWSANIRSTVICIEESFEQTQDCCEKVKIPHIIFMKESEPGVARLKSWSKDRYYEKKINLAEIVPHLTRILRHNSLENGEQLNHTRYHYSRSESRSASVSVSENRTVNMTFLLDEKLNASSKRRYENQISNSISNSVRKLSSKVKIEVIVLKAEYELIGALVSTVDLNCPDNNSFTSLCKKFPRHKKILNRIADHIETLRSSDVNPVILFYSLLDNNFKILV